MVFFFNVYLLIFSNLLLSPASLGHTHPIYASIRPLSEIGSHLGTPKGEHRGVAKGFSPPPQDFSSLCILCMYFIPEIKFFGSSQFYHCSSFFHFIPQKLYFLVCYIPPPPLPAFHLFKFFSPFFFFFFFGVGWVLTQIFFALNFFFRTSRPPPKKKSCVRP